MKNQQSDSTQQEETISFVFDQQDNRLLINAQTEKVLYCAIFQFNPLIIFESVIKVLQSHDNFKIVEKNNERMIINILKLFDLEFKSKEKMVMDQLRQSIQNLTVRLQSQIQKNHQLTQTTSNLQTQINALEQKLLQTQSSVAVLQNKLIANHQQQLQAMNEFKQTIQTQQAEHRMKMQQQMKSQLTHFINQNNQSKQIMQTANQQTSQNISDTIIQLTDLKTQFDLLITHTIPKCLTLETQFMKFSRIVSTTQEKFIIKKFFTKTVKQAKLLYRASDNDFCAKKFSEKCDGIPNTLTVVWTEFDKKIGGFTPLKWGCKQTADNSKESFIFSLTQNDKLTLEIPEKAISGNAGWGPRFGGGTVDIHIGDKGNTQGSNYADIGRSYKNQKYKCGEKTAWQRFTGGSTGNSRFKTKEWQVWSLQWA